MIPDHHTMAHAALLLAALVAERHMRQQLSDLDELWRVLKAKKGCRR